MERNKVITIMAVYFLVVLIWSTTPLAIKWSGESVGFLFGITARMLIGAVLALLLVLLIYRRLSVDAKSIYVYIASGVAIYGAMMPVYWGAQHIASGLISIIFGLTPIITSLLAARFLHEQSLTFLKMLGALLGVVGLVTIFADQLSLGDDAVLGVSAVLLSVVLHSMSSVWIKSMKPEIPALMITTGGLLFSLPLFLLTCFVAGENLPVDIPVRSLSAIVYLGVMGSVVGFASYYYVLMNLSASTVALITLITPIIAIWIGTLFNAETVGMSVWLGTGCVLSGLVVHQWGGRLLRILWR